MSRLLIITSAKEAMFSPLSVFFWVGWLVSFVSLQDYAKTTEWISLKTW